MSEYYSEEVNPRITPKKKKKVVRKKLSFSNSVKSSQEIYQSSPTTFYKNPSQTNSLGRVLAPFSRPSTAYKISTTGSVTHRVVASHMSPKKAENMQPKFKLHLSQSVQKLNPLSDYLPTSETYLLPTQEAVQNDMAEKSILLHELERGGREIQEEKIMWQQKIDELKKKIYQEHYAKQKADFKNTKAIQKADMLAQRSLGKSAQIPMIQKYTQCEQNEIDKIDDQIADLKNKTKEIIKKIYKERAQIEELKESVVSTRQQIPALLKEKDAARVKLTISTKALMSMEEKLQSQIRTKSTFSHDLNHSTVQLKKK